MKLGFRERRGVVDRVEFESKGLKPGNHIPGSRFETRRLSGWVRGSQQLVQPRRGVCRCGVVCGVRFEDVVVVVVLYGLALGVGSTLGLALELALGLTK
jgi:hypothetical protein